MERDGDQEPRIIPLVEEEISVKRRKINTGKIQVRKVVTEREETVDEPARTISFDVERIPVNAFVDQPGPTRQDGETTIIPVYEEVLVTEKKLLLKEEIHLTRRESLQSDPQTLTLRKEEVIIEVVSEESTSLSEETERQSRTTNH